MPESRLMQVAIGNAAQCIPTSSVQLRIRRLRLAALARDTGLHWRAQRDMKRDISDLQ
jgi:hypothetical protein